MDSHGLLGRLTIDSFLAELADGAPAPGGGAAAALAGAFAASLVAMVAGLAESQEQPVIIRDRLRALREPSLALQAALVSLADEDARAYGAVVAAHRLPVEDEAQRVRRQAVLQAALRRATAVPMKVAQACVEILGLAVEAATLCKLSAVDDAAASALLAHAALLSSARNVRANLRALRLLPEDGFQIQTERRLAEIVATGEGAFDRALRAADGRNR